MGNNDLVYIKACGGLCWCYLLCTCGLWPWASVGAVKLQCSTLILDSAECLDHSNNYMKWQFKHTMYVTFSQFNLAMLGANGRVTIVET